MQVQQKSLFLFIGTCIIWSILSASMEGAPKYLPRTALELVNSPGVAKDLGLTEGQLNQFKSLDVARRAAIADLGGVLRDGPNNAAQIMADHRAALDELESQAVAVLFPTQKKRLAQILRQYAARREGITYGLTSPTISSELNLTDDQKDAIKDKATEVQRKVAEKLAKLRKEMEQVVLEGRADLLGVLTKEQRAKYSELMGPDFNLTEE